MRERARRAAEVLRAGFPGDEAGRLPEGGDGTDYWERHAAEPCPALDPEGGTCDLYPERPPSCRSFGPPVRIGAEDLPPCRLCFTTADPGTVERCRVDPDPGGEAEAALDLLGDDAETLVAFALAAP